MWRGLRSWIDDHAGLAIGMWLSAVAAISGTLLILDGQAYSGYFSNAFLSEMITGSSAPTAAPNAFVDVDGYTCDHWLGYDCALASTAWGYSAGDAAAVASECRMQCDLFLQGLRLLLLLLLPYICYRYRTSHDKALSIKMVAPTVHSRANRAIDLAFYKKVPDAPSKRPPSMFQELRFHVASCTKLLPSDLSRMLSPGTPLAEIAQVLNVLQMKQYFDKSLNTFVKDERKGTSFEDDPECHKKSLMLLLEFIILIGALFGAIAAWASCTALRVHIILS